MSVINKMLQDLDKRGAAQDRVGGSIRGAGIAPRPASRRGRWKIAAWALMVPLVLAAGWIALRPGSQEIPFAQQVTPRPAQMQAKADAAAQAPLPQERAPAPSPQPQAAEAAVAPQTPKPVEKPETPAPSPPPQAPVAAAVPPPATVTAAVPPVAPPLPPAPEAAAAPPPTPAVAPPPPQTPVDIAQASVAPSVTPKEPASVSAAPARDVKQARKPAERKDPAMSISKKPPAAAPVAKPEAPVPGPQPRAVAAAPPKAPVVVAQAGVAPREPASKSEAPPQDAAKGSISVERQNRDSSRPERASAEYRNAVALMNQGRVELAIDAYAGALRLDPKHAAARQALVALLMGHGRMTDAQGVLREGLAALPENTAWAMLLARLQVEGGDVAGALATLDGALPYAKNRPDYHAFIGTVLQMQGRHKEAIAHYEIAVRLSPESGRWLTGFAISLEEEKRLPEAREAYQRALATNTLGRDLQAFVERKLGQLR